MKQTFLNKRHLKKPFFEGWYYKNVTATQDYSIALIPGRTKAGAFIQVIDRTCSYYIPYALEDCSFQENEVRIGDNVFTPNRIQLSIVGEITVIGELWYQDFTPIRKTWYAPTIMGPFSYFPMQCVHGILSLHHLIQGTLTVNGVSHCFDQGLGYLEKDHGSSFPREYVWCQGSDVETSFFFSNAHIPVGCFSFSGTIAILWTGKKEYRFASYYGCRTRIKEQKQKTIIEVKSGRRFLKITYPWKEGRSLIAPQIGEMKRFMKETIDVPITISLYKNHHLLFQKELLGSVEQVKSEL